MRRGLLEGCVDSYLSSRTACRGGADRLELCANLSIGGTTPSPSLFQQVRRDISEIPINVLIRPRFGDFLYLPWELEEMQEDIRRFRALGADGVVVGVLTPQGEVDEDAMGRLMDCAGGLPVTLHRAFDMTRDPGEALEAAVRLGCRSILTSGQAESAAAGAETLAALVRQAAGRIDIMAGCGVKRGNLQELHRRAGVWTFHTSARRAVDSGMTYRKEGVSMGLPSLSEYELWQTDEEEISACAALVHGLAEDGGS